MMVTITAKTASENAVIRSADIFSSRTARSLEFQQMPRTLGIEWSEYLVRVFMPPQSRLIDIGL